MTEPTKQMSEIESILRRLTWTIYKMTPDMTWDQLDDEHAKSTKAIESLIAERERLARIDELNNFISFFDKGTKAERFMCDEMRSRIEEIRDRSSGAELELPKEADD